MLNVAVCSLCYKKGLKLFHGKKSLQLFMARMRKQIRHARQARLCATMLQGETCQFLFICFFCSTGATAFIVFSVFPLSFHKKEHILTSLNYKLNCRPTPNKTSVPQGETHGETPVVNVLSATTIEEPTSHSSNPKPSKSVSLQQMLTEDSGASTSPAPSSRST